MNRQDSLENRAASLVQQKYILIVEDDEAIGYFLLLALEEATPYTPLWVATGHDALRIVQDHIPVLFLLNYHLPSMTGLQLYDQLHANPVFETIPAIMVSAHLPHAELKRRNIFGLDKPFDLDELLQVIKRALQPQE